MCLRRQSASSTLGIELSLVAIYSQPPLCIRSNQYIFLLSVFSGLDSKTALDVCRLLAAIAHNGRTVICAIHQPSKRVFEMFDRFLLLNHGRVVYFGKIADSVRYFSTLGFIMPENENPPNFFMEALQVRESYS